MVFRMDSQTSGVAHSRRRESPRIHTGRGSDQYTAPGHASNKRPSQGPDITEHQIHEAPEKGNPSVFVDSTKVQPARPLRDVARPTQAKHGLICVQGGPVRHLQRSSSADRVLRGPFVQHAPTNMIQSTQDPAPKFQAVIRSNVEKTPQWASLDPELREGIEVLSLVLPFRTNKYVMDELIDWTNVPNDPIFNLVFPRSGMLEEDEFNEVRDLVRNEAAKPEIDAAVERIRNRLNPHPAGQMTHNVPHVDGEPIPGLQHKYRETVLFFPAHGQTCHAYCTFCFRWAQFIGDEDLKFANKEVDQLVRYLRQHPEVSDVLFTGGDPMVMKAKVLERYIRPILEDPELEHIRTIRIGTKSVAYWPQRYVSDADADDVLRLFEDVVKSGRTLGIMGHYSHGVELKTDVSREAIRRIRSTGANIRMQSPVIRHVNDDAGIWKDMWREGGRPRTDPVLHVCGTRYGTEEVV